VTDAFVTPAGVLVPAITTERMRAVDRVAIEEVGPNLFQMMENAGRNLALTAIDVLGDRWDQVPIVVLAGIGGNGGGGICAARHLANRGADVTVVVTDSARLGDVPRVQLDVFRGTAGRVGELGDLAELQPGLILDAVIGYSLAGAPRGGSLDLIEWANAQDAPTVSLDVPSGLDSTTGEAPGGAIQATATMTLALPKTGLDAAAVGELWLADIGIPIEVYERVGIDIPTGVFGSRFRVRLMARGPGG
jgi:NAD(P)H-hydrate epimerase